MPLPSKKQALSLLKEHVKDSYQQLHSLMVATALEQIAKKRNEDAILWYVTGLLHDLDYYEYPKEHPKKSLEWFVKWGYPQDLIRAIEAHAYSRINAPKPDTLLAKYLYATDELSGLMYAYSLMRPTGFKGMTPTSVVKKLKDKRFAAKIDRNEVNEALDLIDEERNDFIKILIDVFSNMPELEK